MLSGSFRLVIKGLIRLYQGIISPLFPSRCRFHPTCSTYMYEAVDADGFRGGIKGVKRLLSCHPFSKGGIDNYRSVSG